MICEEAHESNRRKEYSATDPGGYRYSQFCRHYQQRKRQRDVVMRQQHRPGEKLFVDWAGDKISVHEPDRGVLQASLFVAVLGASSYTYAEATEDETMPNWIGAHVRAFEFMGGVAELLVPDNTKTGVSKTCRYEPDLNPTYQEMAMHYGLGVLPARPRKPITTLSVGWILASPAITSVILGASRVEQLTDTLAAADYKLDRALKTRLDEVSIEFRRGDAGK